MKDEIAEMVIRNFKVREQRAKLMEKVRRLVDEVIYLGDADVAEVLEAVAQARRARKRSRR